jgi:hypothetical protein
MIYATLTMIKRATVRDRLNHRNMPARSGARCGGARSDPAAFPPRATRTGVISVRLYRKTM